MAVFKFSVFYVFLAVLLLFVSGCQMQMPFMQERSDVPERQVVSTEDLLQDDVQWNVVDEEEGEGDPLAQHMQARREVNPERLSNDNKHIRKADEMHADEVSHFRVLRLEQAETIEAEDSAKGDVIVIPDHSSSVALESAIITKHDVKGEMKGETGVKVSNPLKEGIGVKKVRLGEHPEKTRFVLDVSGEVAFAMWLQDSDHVLIVNMPDARLDGAHGRVLDAHPFIKAYGFQSDDKGATQFIVTFKKAARLVFKTAMKPNDAYTDHRIVLDVAVR